MPWEQPKEIAKKTKEKKKKKKGTEKSYDTSEIRQPSTGQGEKYKHLDFELLDCRIVRKILLFKQHSSRYFLQQP